MSHVRTYAAPRLLSEDKLLSGEEAAVAEDAEAALEALKRLYEAGEIPTDLYLTAQNEVLARLGLAAGEEAGSPARGRGGSGGGGRRRMRSMGTVNSSMNSDSIDGDTADAWEDSAHTDGRIVSQIRLLAADADGDKGSARARRRAPVSPSAKSTVSAMSAAQSTVSSPFSVAQNSPPKPPADGGATQRSGRLLERGMQRAGYSAGLIDAATGGGFARGKSQQRSAKSRTAVVRQTEANRQSAERAARREAAERQRSAASAALERDGGGGAWLEDGLSVRVFQGTRGPTGASTPAQRQRKDSAYERHVTRARQSPAQRAQQEAEGSGVDMSMFIAAQQQAKAATRSDSPMKGSLGGSGGSSRGSLSSRRSSSASARSGAMSSTYSGPGGGGSVLTHSLRSVALSSGSVRPQSAATASISSSSLSRERERELPASISGPTLGPSGQHSTVASPFSKAAEREVTRDSARREAHAEISAARNAKYPKASRSRNSSSSSSNRIRSRRADWLVGDGKGRQGVPSLSADGRGSLGATRQRQAAAAALASAPHRRIAAAHNRAASRSLGQGSGDGAVLSSEAAKHAQRSADRSSWLLERVGGMDGVASELAGRVPSSFSRASTRASGGKTWRG